MQKQCDPQKILIDIDAKIDLNKNNDRCFSFMYHVLSRITEKFPPLGEKWVSESKKYKNGIINEQDLGKVRKEAWKYSDSFPINTDNPEYHTTRAIICTLFPEHREDGWYMDLYHFLNFCLWAGIEKQVLCDLLLTIFSDILSQTDF